MDDIEERFLRLAELRRESEILAARDDDLRRRCDAQSAELAGLRDRHALEQRDVKRLEGLSFTRVLVALRGSREDRLAQERAEADAALYRVAEVQARLTALQSERAAVEARLGELADLPARYAAAVDEKERYARASGGPTADRLMALAEQRGWAEAELRELGEAAQAAEAARQALDEVARHLDSAGNWSAYDTFLGGGLISSSIKHDRLDNAARAAAYADRCLMALRTELADVGIARPMGSVGVEGMTRFLDVWFDNIFTDMAVRDHIKQAQHNLVNSQRVVAEVQQNVYARTVAARARLTDLARARHDLLVR